MFRAYTQGKLALCLRIQRIMALDENNMRHSDTDYGSMRAISIYEEQHIYIVEQSTAIWKIITKYIFEYDYTSSLRWYIETIAIDTKLLRRSDRKISNIYMLILCMDIHHAMFTHRDNLPRVLS